MLLNMVTNFAININVTCCGKTIVDDILKGFAHGESAL